MNQVDEEEKEVINQGKEEKGVMTQVDEEEKEVMNQLE